MTEPTPFRLNDLVLAECDVDAADLHLPLSPTTKEESEFWSGQVTVIDGERCIRRVRRDCQRHGPQALFREKRIKVIIGTLEDEPEQAVLDYLQGRLATGDNVCDL